MLRRHTEKILLEDYVAADVLALSGTTVTAKELGVEFDIADVKSYNKVCTTAAVAQVEALTIVIPDSCECPYEWGMTIDAKAMPLTYVPNVNNKKYYNYVHPAGATPVASDVATYLAAAINADENSAVTASATGATITLTEKDPTYTRGFNVYTTSGTLNHLADHTSGILDKRTMGELFPYKPGQFGSQPNVATGNSYCRYHFVIRKEGAIQDDHIANAYQDHEMEFEFFARQGLGAETTALEAAYQAIVTAITA